MWRGNPRAFRSREETPSPTGDTPFVCFPLRGSVFGENAQTLARQRAAMSMNRLRPPTRIPMRGLLPLARSTHHAETSTPEIMARIVCILAALVYLPITLHGRPGHCQASL